ncbi:class I SAM-dependent methyltransferase [Candidatus Kaiserbacteria bacterium]|nr:class I SAM-dependent methyltransferase [Candidatus Kaiserbacteria bacterium]
MKCLLCHNETAVEFLNLGNQPLANKYPTEDQFAIEDFFPLAIYFCTTCKNVQLGQIVSRERMFVDYYYLSSVNQGLVRHFEEFATQIKNAKFVVDIGSNDGILLKPLKKLGVKAIGVEPSVNVSKIANDAGLETITSFFDTPTVAKIVAEHGKSDLVVTSSVFTHVENPHQIIEDVKNLMTDDGAFVIEVEHIGAFVENTQFERFYFDRPYYYSTTSLRDLFALHDMYVADVEHITPHGGSIRVTAHKNGHSAPKTERFLTLLKEEEKTLTLATMEEFKNRSETYVRAFREKLEEYKKTGVKVAGYSAPARVSTICNYGNIGPDLIEFLVDDSPLKQNKCSPGTHIPIVPKEHLEKHGADLLVVFAYEYLDDIRKKTEGHNYRYLIPIPPREVA